MVKGIISKRSQLEINQQKTQVVGYYAQANPTNMKHILNEVTDTSPLP